MKRGSSWSILAVSVVVLASLGGCKRKEPGSGSPADPPRGAPAVPEARGTLLVKGAAADLRVSPDGKFASYLLETRKPAVDGIPAQMLAGDAWVVSTSGGEPRKLGKGVTNAPGGLLFTPDSRAVLFVSPYDPRQQMGPLHALSLAEPQAEPVRLGEAVTYVVPSADGAQLAFVDAGVLKLGPSPRGPFRDVAGEVSTAQFSPDGKTLYFKRQLSAAGGLNAVSVSGTGAPKKLGEQVGDYAISPDSRRVAFQVRSREVRGTFELMVASLPALEPVQVAKGTANFAFSPDGHWLGRNEGGRPELVGDLFVGPATGGAGKKIAERVMDFAFAPDSKAVAYLDHWDEGARAGLMGVAALPAGVHKRLGGRAPNFAWGADSQYVAFLSRFLKPMYSVDLMLYRMGEDAAVKAQPGVFGYSFTEKNESLLFRAGCVRNGRECELQSIPLPRKEGPPETWVSKLFTYRPSEDGTRYLATFARMDSETHDLAVFDVKTRTLKRVDQGTQLPALFAAKDGSKLVYLITRGDRAGVYTSSVAF